MTYATSRRPSILLAALVALLLLLTGAPVAAHGGSAPARPTGLTAAGFHGSIALDHEIVSPYVRLDWDEPGDTSITHYEVLRRDAGHARERALHSHRQRHRLGPSSVS